LTLKTYVAKILTTTFKVLIKSTLKIYIRAMQKGGNYEYDKKTTYINETMIDKFII